MPLTYGLCLQALLGLVVCLGGCWLCSEARARIAFKSVFLALTSQAILALLTLKYEPVGKVLLSISHGIAYLKTATLAGTSFVFGYIGGGKTPFEVVAPQYSFVFAFQALPMIMVVSALAMLLFYWRILPQIVRVFAFFFRYTLGIGGALGVCAAAKVFLGQTEAPLLIRPYLAKLSRSELFSVMTLGMATTSASVMVLYASILEGILPEALHHILTASVISVPAAIALSRIIVPHEGPDTGGEAAQPFAFEGSMEAIAYGTQEGLKLFLNIMAMLVVMLSLVSLANGVLGQLSFVEGQPLSLQWLLGQCLAPIAFLMGIPWSEASAAGQLIGVKMILNEVMAFVSLAQLPEHSLSEHAQLIMTYALCGFANLSSIGMQIAGFGTLVPERRQEIISLAGKAMLVGTLASCLSGMVVGLIHLL